MKDKHHIEILHDSLGYKGSCICGGYTIGYFRSEASAKRAIMNGSHFDERKRVEFMEVKQDA